MIAVMLNMQEHSFVTEEIRDEYIAEGLMSINLSVDYIPSVLYVDRHQELAQKAKHRKRRKHASKAQRRARRRNRAA